MSQEPEPIIGAEPAIIDATPPPEPETVPAAGGVTFDETVGGTTLTASLDADGSVAVVILRDGHTVHHFNYKTPPETRPDITA